MPKRLIHGSICSSLNGSADFHGMVAKYCLYSSAFLSSETKMISAPTSFACCLYHCDSTGVNCWQGPHHDAVKYRPIYLFPATKAVTCDCLPSFATTLSPMTVSSGIWAEHEGVAGTTLTTDGRRRLAAVQAECMSDWDRCLITLERR